MSSALGIERVDFVGVPARDMERARQFYGETLELRQDERSQNEFWAGDTCFSIWMPERAGFEFAPSRGYIALHVADVKAARERLETKGVGFQGEILDTSVCHMAFFEDPDGNALMLHSRYAPFHD